MLGKKYFDNDEAGTVGVGGAKVDRALVVRNVESLHRGTGDASQRGKCGRKAKRLHNDKNCNLGP